MRSAALIGLTLTVAAGSTAAVATAAPVHKHHKASKRAAHKPKRTIRATTTTLLGNAAVGSFGDASSAGEASAFSYSAVAGGTAKSLSVYIDSGNAATSVAVGLYSNSSGRPGQLLAQGATTAPQAGAWNAVAIPATTLVSGRRYWLAILGRGGDLRFRDTLSSTCQYQTSSSKTLTALPSSWSTGAKWNACGLSGYASTLDAPTTTTPPPTTTTPPPTTTTPPPTTTTPPPTTTTPSSCTLSATPSTLASVFSGASAGSVICLASGSYPSFTGGTKSGTVTIRPADGASAALSVALGSDAQNIRFDGFSALGGWDLNGSKNITFANSTFTSPMQVRGTTSGIVFDNVTFDGLGHGTWEGRLTFAQGAGNAVVKNSHFGNGGCSDGIQLNGGAHDVTIQGNTFSGIRQGTCTEHADPIQFYGATNTTVVDNFFTNNSTGIMTPDGNGNPMTVKNNVWVMDEYPYAIAGGGVTGSTVSHNVVIGATLALTTFNAGTSNNNTVQNNASTLTVNGSGNVVDHNLAPSGLSFVGGSGRCAYKLASTSAGRSAGSDGTDIGLNDCP